MKFVVTLNSVALDNSRVYADVFKYTRYLIASLSASKLGVQFSVRLLDTDNPEKLTIYVEFGGVFSMVRSCWLKFTSPRTSFTITLKLMTFPLVNLIV